MFKNDGSVLIIGDNDADGLSASILLEVAARAFNNKITRYNVPQSGHTQVTDFIDFSMFTGVYVADLSLTEKLCDDIFKIQGSYFRVFDHHSSANWLADKPYSVFDDSGDVAACALVYDALSFLSNVKIDLFSKTVEYISDRDTWQFKLHESKAVNTWISTQKMEDIKQFEDIVYQINNNLVNVIKLGKAIIGHVDNTALKYIQRMGRGKCGKININGIDIPLFNNTNDISEILHQFLEYTDKNIAGSFFIDNNLDVIVSLRSVDGSAKTCAQIMSGGGHPNAAGFKVSINEFRAMYIQ